jgi:uncharacterized protein DUF4349
MTHPDNSTATIERDLNAVEAALAAGAAGHDDPDARELQELALALRADAPRADAGFAQALEERVREGFPPEPGSARGRVLGARASVGDAVRRLPSPRRMLPAAAALVTVVVIGIGVAALDPSLRSSGGDGEDGGSVAQSGGGGGAAEPGGGDGGGGEGAAPPPSLSRADRQDMSPPAAGRQDVGPSAAVVPGLPRPGPGGFAPGRRDRKIERSISMTLEAPDEEIPALASRVTEVTNRHGGFVLSSSLNSDDEGADGYFELRIPTGRLRAALADLAGLATVRSQSQSGQDVTRRHVTTRDRLESARAERRSLLRRLELATTDEEAESIRRRLDIVAGEINGLRSILRSLRLRTDYAVVTVELAGEEGDSGSGGAGGSFDDAVSDAGDLLVGLTGALIRILAIALPLGLIALAAWLASRAFRRRRRESVLA